MSEKKITVWVVTETLNDYDGDRDKYEGVTRSYRDGVALVYETIAKKVGKGFDKTKVKRRKRTWKFQGKTHHAHQFKYDSSDLWGDYEWDLYRERI